MLRAFRPLLLVLLLLAPVVGTVTQGDTAGSAASLTFSHTVASGTKILLLGISSWQQQISTVTWNTSENLSLVTGTRVPSGDVRSEYWYLLNPTATTANIVITPASSTWLSAGAQNWTGVDTGTPFSNGTNAGAASGQPTMNVTCVAGAVVVDVLAWWNPVTPVEGSGQTAMWIETE